MLHKPHNPQINKYRRLTDAIWLVQLQNANVHQMDLMMTTVFFLVKTAYLEVAVGDFALCI